MAPHWGHTLKNCTHSKLTQPHSVLASGSHLRQCLSPLLLQSKVWLVHCLLQEPTAPSHHTKADESSTTGREYLQGRAEHSEEDSGGCGDYSTDRGPETPVSGLSLFSAATHHFKGPLPYLFLSLRSISPPPSISGH